MMELTIKETKDPDLLSTLNADIQTLHHQLHPEVFKPYDKSEVITFFSALEKDDSCKAFVAYRDGNPVGYVLMMIKDFKENPFQHARRYVELDQILVLEKNQGIGQLLVERVIDEAKSLGIERIELNHWTTNETAGKFFQGKGFERFTQRMFLHV